MPAFRYMPQGQEHTYCAPQGIPHTGHRESKAGQCGHFISIEAETYPYTPYVSSS